MDEPLYPAAARRLVRQILRSGHYVESAHAEQKMDEQGMDTDDARFVLRNGSVTDVRQEGGTWRYRFYCQDEGAVVVGFRSERELVVVTVWR